MMLSKIGACIAAAAALTVAASSAGAGEAASAASFTEAQVARAAPVYADQCALCHGQDLRGGAGAPGLTGPEFTFSWRGKAVSELFDYVKTMMPPGAPGSLSDAQYADLIAQLLKANGAPAGQVELPADPKQLSQLQVAMPK